MRCTSTPRFSCLALAALSLTAGCDATITEGKPLLSSVAPPVAVSPPLEEPVARLHRLTQSQFNSSLQVLLGPAVPLAPVEPDVDIDGFATVGASQLAISPEGVETYEAVLGAATAWAFASDGSIQRVMGCVPTSVSDACVKTALTTFGRRAYRRPLTDDEMQALTALVTDIGTEATDARVGLRAAAWAMLQSPSFLYRVELGEPTADAQGRHAYTSYEMASRLAAALWASAPDDALLDVAGADGLSTADGVRQQAQRMMADPRARGGVDVYIDDLYNADQLATAIKDPDLFPLWSPALQDAMHQELRLRVEDLVFDHPGDFLSLYDSSTTFVNDALANIYAVPGSPDGGFAAVTLPPTRRGLVGSGFVLATNSLPQRSSPTLRGRFIAQVLLCKVVPPPPPSVVTTIDTSADAGMTLRQQLDAHRNNPVCATCHEIMDPIGLGLENFDSIAVHRDTDRGQPIDASGVLDGVAFTDAASLATALRNHPKAAPCFVQQLYTYAQGRSVMPVDTEALNALTAQFAAGGQHADQALIDLVTSDAFRFVEP